MESMIVGTYCTGDRSHGPFPFRSGMHEGTHSQCCPGPGAHWTMCFALHPSPGSLGLPMGSVPRNPSIVAATRSRCEPQDPLWALSKVASDMAYASASAHRFGTAPA